jgi:hypothetical protein
MHNLKSLLLFFSFYRNFLLAAWLVNAACLFLFWRYGLEAFAVLFWFKIATLALIFYFINSYKQNEFYYYRNLGIPKRVLWTVTLSVDIIVFIILFIITYKIK